MKFIHSLFGNSFLLVLLFAMLLLPIGVMGLSTVSQNTEVLSETSERVELEQEQVNETTNSTDLWQKVNYR